MFLFREEAGEDLFKNVQVLTKKTLVGRKESKRKACVIIEAPLERLVSLLAVSFANLLIYL